MSLLQRKNIHKRHLLWAKLFGICLFFHIVFLFWIFCIYQDNSFMLSLSVHKNIDYNTPILFIPLGTKTTTKVVPIKKATPINTKKNIPPKVTTPPKTTVAQNKTSKPKSTTVATAVVPPKTNVSEVKKIESVKEIAKTEPKKEIVKVEIPKIEEKKPQESSFEPSYAKASEARRTSGRNIAQAIDIEQPVIPIIPDNAQVSHNYREVEALRMQAQLQKEIIQKWKPPIGVSPECTCDVAFFVNNNGMLENIKMIKNSGVMMFDISARQALCAIKMPQWTHGKTLTITFKQ